MATHTGVRAQAPFTFAAAAKNDMAIKAIVYAAALMTRIPAKTKPQGLPVQ